MKTYTPRQLLIDTAVEIARTGLRAEVALGEAAARFVACDQGTLGRAARSYYQQVGEGAAWYRLCATVDRMAKA